MGDGVADERRLENWIEAYLDYVSYNKEPPLSYKTWVAISTVAAVLQRKCYLTWDKQVYPNLYVVLVGPSAARKGSAMQPAAALLRQTGIALSPEAVTREQLIRRLKQSSNEEFVSENGIPQRQASLTIFSEELTVFLGYNNINLMSDLCNWYDCPDPWSYEPKHGEKDNIKNVWVNLIGATTPRLLQTTLPQDSIGGGLTSRIIFVFEPHKEATDPRPFKNTRTLELEEHLQHDLGKIHTLQGEFEIDESFLHSWDNWYKEQDSNPPFSDSRLEPYLGRRGTHILKISMIMNASRFDGNMLLTSKDFNMATAELAKIEKKMPQVFLGVGSSDLSAVTGSIMKTIASRRAITFNNLLGLHMHDADLEALKKVLDTLTAMEVDGKKFCSWDKVRGLITYIE